MSELSIWQRLKSYGLTDAGAAGVMGNMRAESGLCAHRLQSDFTQGYTKSLEYTRAVDAGEKNESFVADCKGYGLCQWTSKGRKAGLLQFAQWQNLSIGDEQMQVDYVWKELNGGDYPVLLKTLTTGDSVAKAASDVCTVYERPYICNTVERTKYAQEYYDKYAGKESAMCKATEQRQRLVDVACSYLGYKEADGSHRKIIDIYNSITPLPRGYRMSYTDPWCAAYVSAMGKAAGLGDLILPECACDPMIALYKAQGRWVEDDGYVPDEGDVIMYDWQDGGGGDNRGAADHVGIVVSCDGRSIKVAEGNISDAVGYRTLEVNGRYIRGYCVPDYGAAGGGYKQPYGADAGEDDEVVYVTPSKATTTSATCTLMLPELRQGDVDGKPMGAVWAMQTLLIARHFACGADGADGDFGPATAQAVKNIQTECSLETDAICGALTWKTLIGGAV